MTIGSSYYTPGFGYHAPEQKPISRQEQYERNRQTQEGADDFLECCGCPSLSSRRQQSQYGHSSGSGNEQPDCTLKEGAQLCCTFNGHNRAAGVVFGIVSAACFVGALYFRFAGSLYEESNTPYSSSTTVSTTTAGTSYSTTSAPSEDPVLNNISAWAACVGVGMGSLGVSAYNFVKHYCCNTEQENSTDVPSPSVQSSTVTQHDAIVHVFK